MHQVLQEGRRVKCKCHGLSGSCDIRTCWNAMPPIDQVSSELRARYEHLAEHVQLRNPAGDSSSFIPYSSSTGSPSSFRYQLVPTVSGTAAVTLSSSSLAFYRSSPDYCRSVAGRRCDGESGCNRTCCGRGHVTREHLVVDVRCRCRFHYCCRVVCEPCERVVHENYCL